MGDYTISAIQPTNTLFIEWVYELDFDRLVFHVDTFPLFRLDNMPPSRDVFITSIGQDSYGHRACTSDTPEQYRYNWKATPRAVETSVVDQYAQLSSGKAPVMVGSEAVHDLLGVASGLSHLEGVRIRVLEVMVGVEIGSYRSGHDFKELETYSHVDEVGDSDGPGSRILSVMRDMMIWAMYPMSFANCDEEAQQEKKKLKVNNWLRQDVFLHIHLHIDDDETLRAAVVEVSNKIMLERPASTGPDVLYAIIFSGYHLAIVRIDRDSSADATFTVSHTHALPFLPSWYATSPSTPGITALGRLSYLPDPNAVARLAPSTNDASSETLFTNAGILDTLPSEILVKIASYITDDDARYTFASLSPRTKQGSIDILRDVYVNGWPLLDISERDASDGEAAARSRLTSAFFTTILNNEAFELSLGTRGLSRYGTPVKNLLKPSELGLNPLSEERNSLESMSCGMVQHPWAAKPGPGSKGMYYAVVEKGGKVQVGCRFPEIEDEIYEEKYVEKDRR